MTSSAPPRAQRRPARPVASRCRVGPGGRGMLAHPAARPGRGLSRVARSRRCGLGGPGGRRAPVPRGRARPARCDGAAFRMGGRWRPSVSRICAWEWERGQEVAWWCGDATQRNATQVRPSFGHVPQGSFCYSPGPGRRGRRDWWWAGGRRVGLGVIWARPAGRREREAAPAPARGVAPLASGLWRRGEERGTGGQPGRLPASAAGS